MLIPKSRPKARAVPLAVYQRTPGRAGYARAPLVAAVVEMVRVAVPAEAPVIFTGLVEPKPTVGRSWAPVGLDVTAAVRVTLPVKPPLGVTVIVEVAVCPGETEDGDALPARSVKPCAVPVPASVTATTCVPTVIVADRCEGLGLGATKYSTEELKGVTVTQVALLDATIGHEVVTDNDPLTPVPGALIWVSLSVYVQEVAG